MTHRTLAVAAVGLAAVLVAVPAQAVPFVGTPSPSLAPVFGTLIDFDDKATGTLVLPLDYIGLGVTVQELEGVGTFARYLGTQSFPNYIGTGSAGERDEVGDPEEDGWDGTIRFTFTGHAKKVGIGVADSRSGPETISIYGDGGVLLESFLVPEGLNVYVGFDRLAYDISYFQVSGDFFAVDDLQFDAVPEPGSLLLLGSGLLGLTRLRRRR